MITSKFTDAIIIAAGVARDPELNCVASSGPKCLVPVNDKPALSYLVQNLKNCEHISRVVLVCDEATCEAVPGADLHILAKDDSTESILKGVRAVSEADRCLIMTGDMPLASCEALDDFLGCAPDVDVVYPIVGKADMDEYFPGKKSFYVQAKEGKFTGSSCLLFKPSIALSREQLVSKLLNARKDPKSLLSLVGPAMALKFMFSTLSLRDFEEQLSKTMGVAARVFVSHFPELIMSIDTVDDIRMIERELAG